MVSKRHAVFCLAMVVHVVMMFLQGTPGLPGTPGTPGVRGRKVSKHFFFLNKIISDINSWRKQLFTSSSRVRKDFLERLGVMVTKDREEDLDREEPQETADRKEMRWTGT